MLPLKVYTVSPYVKDRTRLLVMTSGAKFGAVPLHDEHIVERLDRVVANLDNDTVHQTHHALRMREYPDLSRERVSGNMVVSDILLRDTFRQHHGIAERYRKFLPNMADIRSIYEPSTKFHRTISRGYERDLVDFIGRVDSEMIDRQTLKPVIV